MGGIGAAKNLSMVLLHTHKKNYEASEMTKWTGNRLSNSNSNTGKQLRSKLLHDYKMSNWVYKNAIIPSVSA